MTTPAMCACGHTRESHSRLGECFGCTGPDCDGSENEEGLNMLGEAIEEWATLNDRRIGTVGSYRLAEHVVELLHADPGLAALLGFEAFRD